MLGPIDWQDLFYLFIIYFLSLNIFLFTILFLSLKQKGTCPNNCNGHGQCIQSTGTCNCDSGYTGVACDQTISSIGNGMTVYGSNMTQNQWYENSNGINENQMKIK